MWKTLLTSLLSKLPLNLVIGFLLDMLEDFAEKTANKIDDHVVKILRAFLQEATITTEGIIISDEVKNILGEINFKTFFNWIIEQLENLTSSTDTELDDAFVGFIKDLFQKYNLI